MNKNKRVIYAVIINWGGGLWKENPIKLYRKNCPVLGKVYSNDHYEVLWKEKDKLRFQSPGYNCFIFDKFRDAKIFTEGAKAFYNFCSQFFCNKEQENV